MQLAGSQWRDRGDNADLTPIAGITSIAPFLFPCSRLYTSRLPKWSANSTSRAIVRSAINFVISSEARDLLLLASLLPYLFPSLVRPLHCATSLHVLISTPERFPRSGTPVHLRPEGDSVGRSPKA